MKKAFALILAMLLTVTWLGGSAAEENQTEFQSGDYSYVLLEDGTAEISDYIGDATELAIPDTLDGHTVTGIGDGAFYECESLASVTIPDSVTSIGEGAFSDCSGLIGITIPDSVTSIGKSAFTGCTSLTSVTIPDSVTSIGDGAFQECEELVGVTIGKAVEHIGANPFAACGSLADIVVSPNHPRLSVIDGALFHKPDKRLICCPDMISGDSYATPSGTQSIGGMAFAWCRSLAGVTIPDSVTSIGYEAFYDCDKLTLTVGRNSYAKGYAIENDIPYIYPDTNDYEYVAPETFPSYTPASLNQRMATRSGPGTDYTEEGAYNQDTAITLLQTVPKTTAVWGLVEFKYKGQKLRAYTGMQRIDYSGSVPQGALEPYQTAILSQTTRVYYGPGYDYKQRKEVPAGMLLQVYGTENGFYMCDYQSDGKWIRAYFPAI